VRDWRRHWATREPLDGGGTASAMRQVGKTVGGVAVPEAHLDRIVAAIVEALELSRADICADLGCGNGLVTVRVAPHVAQLVGVDGSAVLVSDAERFYHAPNLRYACADLGDPDAMEALSPGTRKLYAYEVWQHLAPGPAARVLSLWRAGLGPGLRILLGSIPDAARLGAFYDTPERWAAHESHVRRDDDPLGHWWTKEELQRVAVAAGYACDIRPQSPDLYTAHYRFDALLMAHA
jgi:SAM-dependent methyltransferase